MTQNVEPQEEMKEVLNEQETIQENTPNQEGGGLEESQSNQEEGNQEGLQEQEIDPKDPLVVQGKELMKEQMQDAFNKKVSKVYGKFREREESIISEFTNKINELEKRVTAPKEAPKIENFEDPNDFVKASMEYHKPSAPKPQSKQEEFDPSVYNFAKQEAEYEASHPGYYERVQDLKKVTTSSPAMLEAIFDAGPEVADVLSKDLIKADEISRMSPARMGRAIAQLENEFKRSKPLPKKAQPKPAPTAEHRGPTSSQNDIANMSKQDFAKMMAEIRT